MVSLMRLALGDVKLLTVEVMVLAFIVALAVGAKAFVNVVESFTYLGLPSMWDYFINAVYDELKTITYLWSSSLWFLVVVATYLVSNYVLRSVVITYATLTYLGSSKTFIIELLLIRYVVIASITWLVGWSIGLTTAQVVFRFTAYIFGAPYEVPYLSLGELVELAVMVYPLVILGSVPAMIRVVRCGF
ncbi:MAG: hypothetical protein QXO98_00580 [Sulfolobales archaeon]